MYEAESGIDRRFFLKLLATKVVAGIALVVGGKAVLDRTELSVSMGRKISEFLDEHSNSGKFITRNEFGFYIESPTPEPLEVEFKPFLGENTVRIRRQFSTGSKDESLNPNEIKTKHAVRVFGYGYPSNDHQNFGGIKAYFNQEVSAGGLWFMLTDNKGNPVNPSGSPLIENENPWYIAGNHVTVISNNKQPQK